MRARLEALSTGLEEMGCEALIVVAASAEDTDLAPFLPDPAHLGECFLILPRGGEPRLGFLTLMEREEAAGTGLALLTPDDLDISKLSSEMPEAGPFLARVWGRALELCGGAPGRVALAGHGPAGVIQGACSLLAARGWVWVPGNSLVFASRKRKEATELAGIREAAEGTCEAMRAVAAMLATASHDGPGSELRLLGEPLTVARVRAEVARVFFELHEFPTFKKASGGEGVLREGDVFTIEPGLYEPAPQGGQTGWAVRLEDLVYLGPDGLESLTPLPYDLDPRAYL